MSRAIRKLILKSSLVIAGGGVLIFSFQNCGKAGFDDALDTTSIGTVDAKSASAPFAYDASFDQITYNSCANTGASNKPGFFSFRAGSYVGAGVNVRPEFFTYAKSNLKPAYPATEITVEQYKAFAAGTPENSEATLQLSLRTRGAPNQLLTAGGAAPILGYDFVNLMMDLTDDRMLEPVFRSMGASVNFFPLASTVTQRVMEGSISYNKDIGMAHSVRNELINGRMLALTYTAFRGAPYGARAPANNSDATVAYGRGYIMNFSTEIAPYTILLNGNPAVQPDIYNPNNTLVGIQEVNLEQPSVSTGAAWNCPQARRYVIMRVQDAAACPADSYDRLADANYRAELEVARRHLRPDQWDISVDRRCAVPKSGSCYMNNSGVEEAVEYNQANQCYYGVTGVPTRNVTNRCAEYISICNKN
ncbi:MAG: hypothetical protein EOP06_08740 [Proteobacteria bacterium]|nr:MAG: hypothetical protein EOP06_08740 [Pseudomonadota bacterium]